MPKSFDSFSAFYPVYLRMHDHPVNRRLHIVGNLFGVGAIALGIAERRWWMLALAPLLANAFAWSATGISSAIGRASFTIRSTA